VVAGAQLPVFYIGVYISRAWGLVDAVGFMLTV